MPLRWQELDEAESIYRKALEMDPTDASTLSNLGHLLHTVRFRLRKCPSLRLWLACINWVCTILFQIDQLSFLI